MYPDWGEVCRVHSRDQKQPGSYLEGGPWERGCTSLRIIPIVLKTTTHVRTEVTPLYLVNVGEELEHFYCFLSLLDATKIR